MHHIATFIAILFFTTTALAAPEDVGRGMLSVVDDAKNAAMQQGDDKYTHRFMFGDTIKDNESASELREKLKQIVKDKDVDALMALMHEDINLAAGHTDEFDPDTIKQVLQLDKKPNKSPLWEELEKIIPLGGTASDSEIIMPYMAAYDFPKTDWTLHTDDNEDSNLFNTFVTIKATPLFKDTNKDGALLRMLKPWETLRIVIDKSDKCEAYKTHDGLKGCVDPAHVRSPLDYRVGFVKQDGEWKLKGFLAGE